MVMMMVSSSKAMWMMSPSMNWSSMTTVHVSKKTMPMRIGMWMMLQFPYKPMYGVPKPMPMHDPLMAMSQTPMAMMSSSQTIPAMMTSPMMAMAVTDMCSIAMMSFAVVQVVMLLLMMMPMVRHFFCSGFRRAFDISSSGNLKYSTGRLIG
ncbi:hypothetical protein BT93_H1726 [Corymbia citriodora subsp. variegata]|nr:hypothetical protein BT93_H1726 [Corymbia citriodora subsp. variegata]